MTGTEVVVIILAGVVGYWLVAVLIPHLRRDPQRDQSPESADPGEESDRAWHKVLGVDVQASQPEIVAAYKRQISQYHPDRTQQLAPEIRALAEQRSKEINRAYDIATKLRE